MSIQSQVSLYLKNNIDAKLRDLERQFPKNKRSTLNSCLTRFKNIAKNNALDALNDPGRITMDMVEQLIIRGKTPIPLLRVMTDFLKVKSQDHSELQEIDLSIFYKKAMEE